MKMISKPLPDTRFYRTMAAGHITRTGHALDAVLVSEDDGATWCVQRACCDTESDNR